MPPGSFPLRWAVYQLTKGAFALHQVVELCHECLEKQDGVLADTHLYKLRVLSVTSEVLSYLQCFSEAAAYAKKMVEGYT